MKTPQNNKKSKNTWKIPAFAGMTDNFRAFTLVELIVVITILVILGTIAFTSLTGFQSSARDSDRVTTLKNIESGLDIHRIKSGSYPMPEWEVLTGALMLSGSEVVYSHMWIIWEDISRIIKINKTPTDPVSDTHYVYAVNATKDAYQIAAILENTEANKFPIISQVYANDSYKAKVVGNHEVNVKIPNGWSTYLTTVPSMIFTGTGNILNSSWSYHVVNGGQNLPYKIEDTTTTTKQNGDETMQHVRKTQDAKIVTVDITEIVNATTPTERKAKIEEIFWTGSETQILANLWWISSKEALVSIGAISWMNEIPNTQILTQAVETIITGWTTSSTAPAPKTDATCGTANTSYPHTETTFWADTFCSVWTVDWTDPTFPTGWNTVNWTCNSPDGWSNVTCSATKLNPDEESVSCTGKPDNSKYYNSSDTHEVTVSFGSPAPTPNYNATPSENSCDYSCATNYSESGWSCVANTQTAQLCTGKPTTWAVYNTATSITQTWNGTAWTPSTTATYNITASTTECRYTCNTWFTHQSGQCNDIVAPTWWSFTINNNAATTNTTSVTLNITCPTDVAWSTPIQVTFWNTTNPNSNWQNCTSSLSHTLTTWDGTKTVYMKFKDSVGNVSGEVSDGISYSQYTLLWSAWRYGYWNSTPLEECKNTYPETIYVSTKWDWTIDNQWDASNRWWSCIRVWTNTRVNWYEFAWYHYCSYNCPGGCWLYCYK